MTLLLWLLAAVLLVLSHIFAFCFGCALVRAELDTDRDAAIADRDQWEATAAEENAKRRELEKQIAGSGTAAITDEGRAVLSDEVNDA